MAFGIPQELLAVSYRSLLWLPKVPGGALLFFGIDVMSSMSCSAVIVNLYLTGRTDFIQCMFQHINPEQTYNVVIEQADLSSCT